MLVLDNKKKLKDLHFVLKKNELINRTFNSRSIKG